nr:hypothetical protein [uncultured Sphingomonas sp.]
MTTELDNAEQAELARFIEHKDRFFALIGHCVTRYQSIEDSLPGVFAAALGGDPARAHAVFAVVRGLEAKLNLISAALTGQDGMPADYWPSLLHRIAAAAEARNQIAHSAPVSFGAISIKLDDDKRTALEVKQTQKKT